MYVTFKSKSQLLGANAHTLLSSMERNVCTGLLHRFPKRHQRWANGFRQDPTEGPLQELQGVLAESVCPCHWKNNFALHLQIHTTAMVRNTCLCCTDLILFETYQKHLQSACSLAFLGFQNLQHTVDRHTGLLGTCESHAVLSKFPKVHTDF